MLVLSRKAGQEIVLPNCGVTIGVVAVHGKQVRLGIVAPSEVPVHRGEVWDRIQQPQEDGPDLCECERSCMVGESADSAFTSQRRATATDQGAAWQHEIRRRFTARTHGHVFGIEVEEMDDRVIVHGRSHSYYGKQLACAAALELIESLNLESARQVELDIQVV